MNQLSDNICDVLIVGAGPTGLTLANILQQSGIKCKIIDYRSGISTIDSKCTTTHIRVLEIFKQLGIDGQVFLERRTATKYSVSK